MPGPGESLSRSDLIVVLRQKANPFDAGGRERHNRTQPRTDEPTHRSNGDPQAMIRRLRCSIPIRSVGSALAFLWAGTGFADEPGWVALFDGKSLDGWKVNGGFASYKVEDGAIVGTTVEGSSNTFLCKGDFRDFELELEVKCDPRLNSGVQVRKPCLREGRPRSGRAAEGQASSTDRNARSPARRQERRAGSMMRDDGVSGSMRLKPEAKEVFKDDDWNRYRIIVQGNRYRSCGSTA